MGVPGRVERGKVHLVLHDDAEEGRRILLEAANERPSDTAVCSSLSVVRARRHICSSVRPGAWARWARALASSRVMRISAAMRACSALAGLGAAISSARRVRRARRQVVGASGGGAGMAASVASSRSALRW